MAVTFVTVGSVVSSTGSITTVGWSGTPGVTATMLVAVFGFEGVAGSSGPWVDLASVAVNGWYRAFYQPPSATGSGLEVMYTWGWSSGSSTPFPFLGTYTYVARGLEFIGNDPTAPVRASASQAWTGNNPQAPSIYAYQTELLVAVAAEEMASPGFGTPSGWTQRSDDFRSAYGNVEITSATQTAAAEGMTGAVPWTATAETGTTRGATGILAIRPGTLPAASTSPLIAVEYPATIT